jgi:hypothetical protein
VFAVGLAVATRRNGFLTGSPAISRGAEFKRRDAAQSIFVTGTPDFLRNYTVVIGGNLRGER